MAHAFAASTRSTYGDHVRYFLRWVVWMGYTAFLLDIPYVSTIMLKRYVTFLALTQSYKTVKLCLNGVRLFYIGRGLPNPMAENFAHHQHLQGIRRMKGDATKQKLPITPRELLWLVSACNTNAPAEVAFTCAALIAFFAFLRKSNVTTGHQHTEDITHALLAGDVAVDEQSYTLWIRLRCTKTLQYSERTLDVPIRGNRGSPIDPIAWWKLHLQSSALPRAADTHAFAYQLRGRWVSLTHSAFVKQLKLVLEQHGIDSRLYASHSFRRGGATFAFIAGASGELIKALGDWRSATYLRYIDLGPEMRMIAAQRMATLASQQMSTSANDNC